MEVSDFLNIQNEEAKKVFMTLDLQIRQIDKTVTVEIGSIMNVKQALVYRQDNIFKYGLAATKNHFSYHSMVMYAYPKILDDFKKNAGSIKFQKGCFNFKTFSDINTPAFEEFLKTSAKQDFTPVINHYKNKK